MRRAAVIATAILCVAAPGRAKVVASLEAVTGQDPSAGPYRWAELRLDNAAAAQAESVLLRPAGGGPTVRYALAVPPGASGRLKVALPAISPAQEYEVTVLDAGGSVVGRATAAIDWPAELVATEAFIDRAYRPWWQDRAAWSRRTRLEAVLLSGALVVALGGALLVRRGSVRLVIVVAMAAAAVALVPHVPHWPEAAEAARYRLVRFDPGGRQEEEWFTVVSARRSARVVLTAAAGAAPYPVYADRADAAGDDCRVDPIAGTISLPLGPGTVRVIRPAVGRAAGRGAEPAGKITGTARPAGDALTVEAQAPHQRALLIRDDSCWQVASGFGWLRMSAAPAAARPIWSVMSSPEQWRLGRKDARLLDYWRSKYQGAGKTYLVNFPSADADEVELIVGELGQGSD